MRRRRRGRSDEVVNFRRLRIQLTLLYGLVSAFALGGLALAAINLGDASIRSSAEREAEQKIADVTAAAAGETGEEGQDDTWFVSLTEDYVDPLGDETVEPPLFTVAEEAVDSGEPVFEEFDQSGPYLAHARQLNDDVVIATALSLDETHSDISSLRLQIAIAALAALIVASVGGYWLAGRSLRPARVAVDRQRAFVADAAHEIRTPLATIQASASQALQREREPREYEQSLVEIRIASERAGASVTELLDFARLEAGQTELRRSPVRIDLLVEEVRDSLDSESVDVFSNEPVVADADVGLIRRAIENVVRNAAARADSVTVSTRVEDGDALIEVRDDGPGFPPELLPHVFERFQRGDQRGTSGLGLAIAAGVVRSHGGDVDARNLDGGGAVVRLWFPMGV